MPFWARDPSGVGEDRSLDLPCFGPKLKGDYNPPFTCGSDTRRSIIKYFVRDEVNGNSRGSSLAEKLVRERIRQLKAAWSDERRYACECATDNLKRLYGNHSLLCCRVNDASLPSDAQCTCLDGETVSAACCAGGNNFLPRSLQVLFDEIPAEEVVNSVIEKIEPFIQKIMSTREGNVAFRKYNDKAKVAKWNWVDQGLGEVATKGSWLYSTSDPIMAYNASEAGYPFKKDQTIWEMCAGLVGQVRSICCFFGFPFHFTRHHLLRRSRAVRTYKQQLSKIGMQNRIAPLIKKPRATRFSVFLRNSTPPKIMPKKPIKIIGATHTSSGISTNGGEYVERGRETEISRRTTRTRTYSCFFFRSCLQCPSRRSPSTRHPGIGCGPLHQSSGFTATPSSRSTLPFPRISTETRARKRAASACWSATCPSCWT